MYLGRAGSSSSLDARRAISHNRDLFSDPDAFIPERFLDENGDLDLSQGNPMDFAFGFGRRWISTLSALDITQTLIFYVGSAPAVISPMRRFSLSRLPFSILSVSVLHLMNMACQKNSSIGCSPNPSSCKVFAVDVFALKLIGSQYLLLLPLQSTRTPQLRHECAFCAQGATYSRIEV